MTDRAKKMRNKRAVAQRRMRERLAKWSQQGLFTRCVYCGIFLTKESLTIDHVVPLSAGGTNKKENLVTACSCCNSKKANETWAPKFDMLFKLKDSYE